MPMKVQEKDLVNIRGGASMISATVLNAIARTGQFLYDLGRNLGTAVRMIGKKKIC